MISLKVLDVKTFMSNILIHSTFDRFLIWEMDIITFNSFHISGKIHSNWYEEGERDGKEEYSHWNTIKPFAFQVMKGQKTPQNFKIILQLSKEDTQKFLEDRNLSYQIEDINGLFLNIKYEHDELHIITGTSLKVFLMDKSLEHEWDHYVQSFLKEYKIAAEE